MEFGLFSKIDVRLLKSFKWKSDLIQVTILKVHSSCCGKLGVQVRKPAGGGGRPGKGSGDLGGLYFRHSLDGFGVRGVKRDPGQLEAFGLSNWTDEEAGGRKKSFSLNL